MGTTEEEVITVSTDTVNEDRQAGKYAYALIVRNIIVSLSVTVIMYLKIDKGDCNLISMIFFAILGISSLIELGFPLGRVLRCARKAKDDFE